MKGELVNNVTTKRIIKITDKIFSLSNTIAINLPLFIRYKRYLNRYMSNNQDNSSGKADHRHF